MVKLRLLLFCLLAFSASLWAQTATAPSAGDGNSAGTAYEIATLDNLYWLATQVNGGTSYSGKFFRQTTDIDASSSSGWASGGFVSIGNGTNSFSGTYDGESHTISGLYINRSTGDFQGLFGSTSSATIKNLGVTGLSLTANDQIGGLIGRSTNSSVSNCYTTGTISSTGYEGGGLVGDLNGGTVTQCYSNCSISTTTGTWSNSAFVGYGHGSASISNCYSTGAATGAGNAVGGIVGNNSGCNISYSYSVSSVSSSGSYIGGLTGGAWGGSTTSSFWNTTNTASSGSGTGKTDAQMKVYTTFTGAGWDFYGISSGTIWNIGNSRNGGYPYLKWQFPADSPLPVELSSFSASVNNNAVTLKWTTATELNSSAFIIQRSVDKNSWLAIGSKNAQGNSNAPVNYTFTDAGLPTGNYYYRLKMVDNDGTFSYSQIIATGVNLGVQHFSLKQNYPNPFNPSTVINYNLPENGFVSLKVYNAIGQLVATLVNQQQDKGMHSINFNAELLPAGAYLYKLQSGEFNSTRKMMLIK